MHPTIKPIPAPLPAGQTASSSSPAGAGLLNGALAAVLGLGGLATTVVLLWISTPSSGTPNDALHVAAALWLAGHGAGLVRGGGTGGAAPMPLDIMPLLLTVCFGLLLWRAARHTADAYVVAGRPPSAPRVVGSTAAGYLTVLTAALGYAGTGGQLRTAVPSALLWPPLFVLAVLACASRPLAGPGRAAAETTEGSEGSESRRRRLLPTWFQLVAASRATVLGVGTLLLGGVVLTGTAVAWRAPEVWRAFPDLAGSWAGYLAVLLLTLVLLPNALVWSTAYALGPGFTTGGDSLVSPLITEHSQLPRFPLLAALPAEGPGTALTWSVGVLPVAASLLTGWYLARVAVPTGAPREAARGRANTLGGMVLTAAGCGVVLALLVEAAGGSLGRHRLAELGPCGWLVGTVGCGWMLLLGAPVALTVRAWRLRGVPSRGDPSAGDPQTTTPSEHPARGDIQVSPGFAARPETSYGPSQSREATHPPGGSPAGTDGPGSVLDAGSELALDDGRSAAGGPPGGDGWPRGATRDLRWAALKRASGGLMSDFEPVDLPSSPSEPYVTDPHVVEAPEPAPEHDPESGGRR